MQVETKPSKLVYFNPYSDEQMRLYLPEGDHVFRAGFINDDFVKGLSEKDALQRQEEQVHRLDYVRRSVPVESGKGQPQEDSDLRSGVGPACVERIVAHAGASCLSPAGDQD